MEKGISWLIRDTVRKPMLKGKGPTVLTREEIAGMAKEAAAIVRRAVWYVRLFYRFVYWFAGFGIDLPGGLVRFTPEGPWRRKMERLEVAAIDPVFRALLSHPKPLLAIGVGDGKPEEVVPPPGLPPSAKTILASSLPDRSTYDFIVVGSGPGGAGAALKLIQQGYDVLVCEEGGMQTDEVATIGAASSRYYAYGGLLAAFGRGGHAVPTLSGRVVGGSTILNVASCLKPSPKVVAQLYQCPEEHAAPSREEFDAYFNEAVGLLGVTLPEPKSLGVHNTLPCSIGAAMGLKWQTIPRNAIPGGKPTCLTGRSDAGKLTPDRTIWPRFVELGGTIARRCNVRKVLFGKDGRAGGIEIKADGKKKAFFARQGVVVAAGPIGTPLLLKASGVSHPNIGRSPYFQMSVQVLAKMPSDVYDPAAIEQGKVCLDRADHDGIVYESIWLPPAIASQCLPGRRADKWRELQDFKSLLAIGVIVNAERTPLTVSTLLGAPLLTFDLHPEDIERFKRGILEAAEMLIRAGAKELLIPGSGDWIYGRTDAEDFSGACVPHLSDVIERVETIKGEDIYAASLHLSGTCAMDWQDGVIDMRGRVRDTSRLYVTDASALAVGTVVNPQMTILAQSLRIGDVIIRDAQQEE